MHMQMHSERDPSHVEGGDDRDCSAQQEIPVAEPGLGAVQSQSLEVTAVNMPKFPCVLNVVLLRKVYVAKLSVVAMSPTYICDMALVQSAVWNPLNRW